MNTKETKLEVESSRRGTQPDINTYEMQGFSTQLNQSCAQNIKIASYLQF